MAPAISSAGGRFRPLPTTSDVLTRRSVDRRSTDEHGLRQFPLPRPDAVVPVPQDVLWTYRSPEPSRWAGGQLSELSVRTAVCQSYIQSRVCLATAKLSFFSASNSPRSRSISCGAAARCTLFGAVAADCSSNRSRPSAFDQAKASAPMATRSRAACSNQSLQIRSKAHWLFLNSEDRQADR